MTKPKRPYPRNRFFDTVDMVAHGGPVICNIAVTNLCNARCDFCNYAVDKKRVQQGKLMGYDDYRHAIDILYARGVRYLTLSGGEPFLHPRLYDMVAYAVRKGIRPSVCTNGSRLSPEAVKALRRSGLKTLIVSIDAPSEEAHEKNRGLPGVCGRIRESNRLLDRLSMECVASVTISRLVNNYDRLAVFLQDLGFRTVTFSYPKRSVGSFVPRFFGNFSFTGPKTRGSRPGVSPHSPPEVTLPGAQPSGIAQRHAPPAAGRTPDLSLFRRV